MAATIPPLAVAATLPGLTQVLGLGKKQFEVSGFGWAVICSAPGFLAGGLVELRVACVGFVARVGASARRAGFGQWVSDRSRRRGWAWLIASGLRPDASALGVSRGASSCTGVWASGRRRVGFGCFKPGPLVSSVFG